MEEEYDWLGDEEEDGDAYADLFVELMNTTINSIDMLGTHEGREVKRFELQEEDIIVDTARVTDGVKPIETAVAHPKYNHGRFIIVAAYDTVQEALLGHEFWVKEMTGDVLPDALVDCANAKLVVAALRTGEYTQEDLTYPFQK